MDKRDLKVKRIAVLLGGKSSEREVSLRSGNAVLQSLLRLGYNAIPLDAAGDLTLDLGRERVDLAFIVLHGRWGEDGTVQGLLEMMSIPYTGSGVLGSSISMDKTTMKLLFTAMGIPTPPYVICGSGDNIDFPLPFVVKPANEGSTIGISIVREAGEIENAFRTALKYDRKLVVERFVPGQEITVAVVNGKTLPIVEVKPAKGFYDFEAKYTKGMTEYIVPARISEKVERNASDTALRIYNAFDLSGCARIDMLVEDDMPLVIDINTSPGMTETSLVPKAWGHLGHSFDELVEEILREASLKT
jgi:D-alanine-D-alanine ligase